ncbi:hypothetical protein R1flu_011218 [Riccia fluitans]|uniref:Transposase Helix-turn-helix domain-containing protein n=1 Tax=Riccia fluitans TaxID=41844 RepID=A0ABD1Z772_9MARC
MCSTRSRKRKWPIMDVYLPVTQILQTCLNHASMTEQRRWWVMCRSREWFWTYLGGVYGDNCWQRMMRMKKTSFFLLLSFLEDGLRKQNKRYCPYLPLDLRLSIILHRLGHGTSYFDLGELFGCSEATVHQNGSSSVGGLWLHAGVLFIRLLAGAWDRIEATEGG